MGGVLVIDALVDLYACQPRVRLKCVPLSGLEDPVSPMALKHMRMCDCLLGPFKPARPFVLSVWSRLWKSIWGIR
jgi:hypothetical protein